MKPFQSIFKFLQKPFPEIENTWEYLQISLFLSVFVALFLYVFQPFGIDTLQSQKLLVCFGFGAMTFLGAGAYEMGIRLLQILRGQRRNLTFGKWIIDMLGIVVCISLANFLFSRLVLFGNIEWKLFPQMLYGTLMIGIIPITALGAYLLFRQEKKFKHIAEEISQVQRTSKGIQPRDQQLLFDIPIYRIRFIEALQNYVKVGYLDGGGHFKVHMERATLKSILRETEGSSLIRAHRSYLVNSSTIESITGNAQGLVLRLAECDRPVPVSRSYVPVFREI